MLQPAAEVVQMEPSSKHSAASMPAMLSNHFPTFSVSTLSVACFGQMAISFAFLRPSESRNTTRQDLFDKK